MRVATDSFGYRLRGVLALDVRAYEEVDEDPAAVTQALVVVALGSVSAGIGAALTSGLSALPAAAVLAAAGWAGWTALVYVVGVHLLPEPQTGARMAAIVRVIGFAAAPMLLAAFAFLPVLGAIVQFIVGAWLIMTMIIGVRQALEFRSTARAIGVVLIAAGLSAVVLWLL